MAQAITIRWPFDMHHHVRTGHLLELIVPMLTRRFAGAIIMPNTPVPITDYGLLRAYRKEVMKVAGSDFLPLMTFYLTDHLDPEVVTDALIAEAAIGVKYYPRGLTTNSESGVKDPASLWDPNSKPYRVLRCLHETGGTLLLHAADGFDRDGIELDPYEQEPHFIRETLPRIIDAHQGLHISVEHLSTKEGAAFMEKNGSETLGCSLTAQHLLLDRRDTHKGGLRPNRFWWPIIQSQEHKEALRELARKGLPFVWLGSDSAPHPVGDKETDCCKGGVMMVHAGIELYAEAFDDMGALDKLEAFASLNGPRFYGIAPSEKRMTLVKEPWTVTTSFGIPADEPRMGEIKPFRLGEAVQWKLVA
ncbi:MAG: dihydroorotase [Patescibacteria group bacterium]